LLSGGVALELVTEKDTCDQYASDPKSGVFDALAVCGFNEAFKGNHFVRWTGVAMMSAGGMLMAIGALTKSTSVVVGSNTVAYRVRF
jgi:hypothetical protein